MAYFLFKHIYIYLYIHTYRKDVIAQDENEQDAKNRTERDRLYCFDNYGYRKCANGQ